MAQTYGAERTHSKQLGTRPPEPIDLRTAAKDLLTQLEGAESLAVTLAASSGAPLTQPCWQSRPVRGYRITKTREPPRCRECLGGSDSSPARARTRWARDNSSLCTGVAITSRRWRTRWC